MTGEMRENKAELARRRRVAAVGGIAASLVCAMLIWAKLRLVTDIPRTAYATPRAEAGSADGARHESPNGAAEPWEAGQASASGTIE